MSEQKEQQPTQIELAALTPNATDAKEVKEATKKKEIKKPIRGANVSGRGWKDAYVKKGIASKVKNAALTWEEKQQIRERRKMMRAIDDEIMARKAEEEAKRKEAKKQAIIRKKQNIAKNTIVQQVTNKKKIRHMSAKQFKQLKSFHFDEIY